MKQNHCHQLLVLAVLAAALLARCDDGPAAENQEPWPEDSPPAEAPAPNAPPEAEAKAVEAMPIIELKESDFVEGTNNRDPFRSFISQFAQPTRKVVKLQRPVILPRYSMDELTLIAVVTGGTRPRAMFRDPTGLGVMVKRGDYISKSESRIKQILSDKVIVELTTKSEDKKTQVDQVIELHERDEHKESQ